jgi:hypothetical protein
LDWLAGGRVEPNVSSRYVELFLAGLERRALIDSERSANARAEVDVITAEVERMINRYGDRSDVAHRGDSLLQFLRLPLLEREPTAIDPPQASHSWELPLELRIGLAGFAKTGQPLPVEWALSWLRCSPEAYLRTPAERCRDEFDGLFRLRYVEQYSQGLKLKPPKARITVEHRPSTRVFPMAGFAESSTCPMWPRAVDSRTPCARWDVPVQMSWMPTVAISAAIQTRQRILEPSGSSHGSYWRVIPPRRWKPFAR